MLILSTDAMFIAAHMEEHHGSLPVDSISCVCADL